ncbi:MAG: insulinase family protein, partial [Planctomycetes bacterium]|nr:insulinase family protein [Planctomycetota bacterium]
MIAPTASDRVTKGLGLAALVAIAACSGPPPGPPQPPNGPTNGDPTKPIAPAPGPRSAGLPRISRLANGLTVVQRPYRTGSLAQVQLGILAGSDFSSPGLAELAIATLVRGSDAGSGRKSLQQTITEMGGQLLTETSPLSSWITVRVPAPRWHQAQLAIRDALQSPAMSRSQIERVREDYVVERIQQIWGNPDEVARAFLLGNAGTADYIASLLDRDASEVAGFIAKLYRPDSTFVAVQVPGNDTIIASRLGEGLGSWPAATGPRPTVAIEPRRLAAGIHWSPTPSPISQVLLVLPLPDLATPFAAERLVMHACLTLDGIGGRLERLQRERGLGRIQWQPRIVRLADTPALVLGTTTAPIDAMALWEIASAARQSLFDLPPTASELELAVRRARLTAQLVIADSAAQGRNETAFAVRGQLPDVIDANIRALGQPGGFAQPPAAGAYLREAAAMIVLGGQPPAGAQGISEFELLPPGALARIASPDPVAQSVAATPWLDRTLESSGGTDLLRRVHGFSADCRLHSEGAPEASEQLQWNSSTGDVTRRRTVMGTTIDTVLLGEAAAEQSGDTKLPLAAGEANLLRREMRRHPVSLLAACARGELRFRPVAQRTVADRDLMILEAVGNEFDRLRIH